LNAILNEPAIVTDKLDLPLIDGLYIDVVSLLGISHRFDSVRCGKNGCCCTTYEVGMEAGEMERLVDWQPLAAKYQPALASDEEFDFPFDQDDEGKWVIETGEDATCPFSYRTAANETFCSLHTAAMERGLNPYHVKPRSCSLWPLALSEGDPPMLTVMEGVLQFPCNRKKTSRTLSPGIAELVESCFGESFLVQLRRLVD
jgi:hypothetical protein